MKSLDAQREALANGSLSAAEFWHYATITERKIFIVDHVPACSDERGEQECCRPFGLLSADIKIAVYDYLKQQMIEGIGEDPHAQDKTMCRYRG